MKIQYKSEQKIFIADFKRIPKEVIEKRFIIDFFTSLPIEDLKRLISYKEIDFNNDELWGKSQCLNEKLKQLRYENNILIEANIWLDNEIEDFNFKR